MLTFLKQHVIILLDHWSLWLVKNDNTIIVICFHVPNRMEMIALHKLLFCLVFLFIHIRYNRYHIPIIIVLDMLRSFRLRDFGNLRLLFHKQILSILSIILSFFFWLFCRPVLNEIDLRFLNCIGSSLEFWLFWRRSFIYNLSDFALLKLPSLRSFLNNLFLVLLLRCVHHDVILILLLWKAILIFSIYFNFLFLSEVLIAKLHFCIFLLRSFLRESLLGLSLSDLSGIVNLFIFFNLHCFVLGKVWLWLTIFHSFIHLRFWLEDILLICKISFHVLV